MGLTNAERQARHRARVKEKLRNATSTAPLSNDTFMDSMRFAFIVAERRGRIDALQSIGDKPLLPYDSGWNEWAREALSLFDQNVENLTEEFFIGLIAASAHRMGNRLVMETYREFLAEEVEKQTPQPHQKGKRTRKRVT